MFFNKFCYYFTDFENIQARKQKPKAQIQRILKRCKRDFGIIEENAQVNTDAKSLF